MRLRHFCLSFTLCNTWRTALAQPWKRYPLELSQNAQLVLPGAEGVQPQDQGDSWFLTAMVTGATTGARYQIITIFCRNDLAPLVSLDFYQASVFAYDDGAFNTSTTYDLPVVSDVTPPDRRFSAVPGSLDIAFPTPAGNASWRNVRAADGGLVPFVYRLYCPGTDHVSGAPFAFNLTVDMQKPPVAFGADALCGNFTCFAQKNTLSYFNPGPKITGSLTFRDVTEDVQGTYGHLDRQIFPLYLGIYTPTGSQHSHIWCNINLDSGVDMSVWRQFDRTNNNTVIPDTGITVSYPTSGDGRSQQPARYQDGLDGGDMSIEYVSFQKFPQSQYSTLFPAPSQNMWMPSHIVLRSKALEMELECRYNTPAPVAVLPVDYFNGPCSMWNGTFDGKPAAGHGVMETTLALYRDWELAWVMVEMISHLPVSVFAKSTPKATVLSMAQHLQSLVSSNILVSKPVQAIAYNRVTLMPALNTLQDATVRSQLLDLSNDFQSSLLTP